MPSSAVAPRSPNILFARTFIVFYANMRPEVAPVGEFGALPGLLLLVLAAHCYYPPAGVSAGRSSRSKGERRVRPINVFEYEELARERLHPALWNNYSAGAND